MVGSLFIGCAPNSTSYTKSTSYTNFFGINMKDVIWHEKFYMKLNEETLDDSTDWLYWHDKRTMDTNLKAYGTVKYYGGDFHMLEIRVINNKSTPIQTNYFLDEFVLIDLLGSSYIIEKPSITSYPKASYINPNSELTYRFSSLPVEIVLIEKILVSIGGRKENYIVLKRIPK